MTNLDHQATKGTENTRRDRTRSTEAKRATLARKSARIAKYGKDAR